MNYRTCTEADLRLDIDNVKWYTLSLVASLSEEFMREFADKLNWFLMSRHQVLPESLISEFDYLVDWNAISEYQTLSVEFIHRNCNWLTYCDNIIRCIHEGNDKFPIVITEHVDRKMTKWINYALSPRPSNNPIEHALNMRRLDRKSVLIRMQHRMHWIQKRGAIEASIDE
ncbi:matrix metallopeptidase [Phytophthora pseudosyringae]|uniref:Matrix metallopeptidase n=1 Tax=Phytophthora pseudosyringae TaxID=221518 RepID=A0A8T1V6E1_9STRA|nr:matrix metallopeptidase [Phytophthora pseudosyringae]